MNKLLIFIFSIVVFFNATASNFDNSEFVEVSISCADQKFKVRSLNWQSAWDISLLNGKRHDGLLDFPVRGYDEWGCIKLQGEYYLVLKGKTEQFFLSRDKYYSECIRVYAAQRLSEVESLFSCDNRIVFDLFNFLEGNSLEPFHESYKKIKLHKFIKIFNNDQRLDE